MATGPFYPSSLLFATAPRVFSNVHVGDGANLHRTEGIGVEASLGADAFVHLEWDLPMGTLPAGTCKLRLLALADAVTGDAKVAPEWAMAAVEEDPSALTLNDEGTSTLSWGANDDDEYKELKITLDADTPVAGEILVMHLRFESTSWTLAAVSTWKASLIWE